MLNRDLCPTTSNTTRQSNPFTSGVAAVSAGVDEGINAITWIDRISEGKKKVKSCFISIGYLPPFSFICPAHSSDHSPSSGSAQKNRKQLPPPDQFSSVSLTKLTRNQFRKMKKRRPFRRSSLRSPSPFFSIRRRRREEEDQPFLGLVWFSQPLEDRKRPAPSISLSGRSDLASPPS